MPQNAIEDQHRFQKNNQITKEKYWPILGLDQIILCLIKNHMLNLHIKNKEHGGLWNVRLCKA